MLDVRGLEVRYGNIPAIRDLDFHIDEGETISFIGPNGAGKTTTALTIAGALRPFAGSVLFDGSDLGTLPPEKRMERGIILVPEGRGIFSRLTVRENFEVVSRARLRQRGAQEQRRQLEQLLALFPILRDRFNSYAGLLSGGEQQQLAIARALFAQPRLLILDEPSLGLAPKFVETVFSVLRRLREEGLTILLVDQSLRRALNNADRLYLLRSGSLVAQGASRVLKDDHAFERAYFGEAVHP
ncbi:ABC transporter ATP-binding protein [Pseudochelatococcus sp. B33]